MPSTDRRVQYGRRRNSDRDVVVVLSQSLCAYYCLRQEAPIHLTLGKAMQCGNIL